MHLTSALEPESESSSTRRVFPSHLTIWAAARAGKVGAGHLHNSVGCDRSCCLRRRTAPAVALCSRGTRSAHLLARALATSRSMIACKASAASLGGWVGLKSWRNSAFPKHAVWLRRSIGTGNGVAISEHDEEQIENAGERSCQLPVLCIRHLKEMFFLSLCSPSSCELEALATGLHR